MSSTNPPSNDSNDYFYPGSIVKCVTCYGAEVQGEVIAFDHNTKILVLKQPSTSEKADLSNVAVLNTDFMKSIDVIKDNSESQLPALSPLSNAKLFQRYKSEVDSKLMLSKAVSSGVSKDGFSLFSFLKKTLDCTFNDQNIVVMEEVTIKPPYKPENCLGKESKNPHPSSKQCLDYVKELVTKFHEGGNSKLLPQETAKT